MEMEKKESPKEWSTPGGRRLGWDVRPRRSGEKKRKFLEKKKTFKAKRHLAEKSGFETTEEWGGTEGLFF